MAPFPHSNFAVDYKLDKMIKKQFDHLVETAMRKSKLCRHIQDLEVKRITAIDVVLTQAAEWKLKKKRKAARKNKRKAKKPPTENKRKRRRKDKECLLKECLEGMHEKRLTQEVRLPEVANDEKKHNEEMDLFGSLGLMMKPK